MNSLRNYGKKQKSLWNKLKKKFVAPFYKIAGNLQSCFTPASKEYGRDYSEYDVEGSTILGKRLLDK